MSRKIFDLLLASSSPQRRAILKAAHFSFMVRSSNSSESFDENLNLEKNLRAIAETKVKAVVSELSPRDLKGKIILGADTVVVLGKEVMGKPKNKNDAMRMLRKLSGRKHRVMTAFCLYCVEQQKFTSRVMTTKVGFRSLSKADLQWYVKSGEPLGKAGGYGIQGLAQNFVNYLSGDFLNVIGLPLHAVREELRKHRWYVAKTDSVSRTSSKRFKKNRRS